jgi:Domain of unknown function (DUF4386)
MTERLTETSPQPMARITGVVYLLSFLMALGTLITPGTPNDIVAHESLFRLGYATSLIWIALYVALTALLYFLFKPVSRRLALLAAFFSLVGCTIQVFSSVFLLVPLVLGGGHYVNAFSASESQGLAQMFLDLNVQANYIAVVFFGLFDIVIGYLIFRSTFMPRILGALMAIAGLGWLIFLSPPLANRVLIYIEAPGFIAELALMLWLLAFGVNVQRWKEQARAAGMVSPTRVEMQRPPRPV